MTNHRRVFHPKFSTDPLRVLYRKVSLLIDVKDGKDDERMLTLSKTHTIPCHRAANQFSLDSHITAELLDLRRDVELLGDLPEEILAVVEEVGFPTANADSADGGDDVS
jgi:hypothetical protein